MEIIRGIHNIRKKFFNSVITIGNFDGIHLGHKKILSSSYALSKKYYMPLITIIFEPQPLEFLKITPIPHRLTTFYNKIKYLSSFNIDYILCINFNNFFVSMHPKDFIINILINKLCAKFIVIGHDFKCGVPKNSNVTLLKNLEKKYNFQIVQIDSVYYDDMKISSTKIRETLSYNNFIVAEMLLGRPFSISGRVIHGKKIGRIIGYPTANILLNKNSALNSGVYAVKVRYQSNKYFLGISNICIKANYLKENKILEVHLFHENINLYGKKIEVIFYKKIRNEKNFSSFKMLKNQISQDIKKVKIFFNIH